MENREQAFRNACRDGDAAGAERCLVSIAGPEIATLVERIGGPRAMVRFLVQRRHVLCEDGDALAGWIRFHLDEAEPMHLCDVGEVKTLAERAGNVNIVRRLEAHLQFLQPPDPTRWSRKFPTPEQAAFLDGCAAGDAASSARALAAAAALVGAVDRWGRDGLALLAASGSAGEILAPWCDAGGLLTTRQLIAAARAGAVAVAQALVARGAPLREHIDDDALWSAAAASRELALPDFEELATSFVAAGAGPDAHNRWGESAWGVATPDARAVLARLGAEPRERGAARYDPDTGCSEALAALADGRAAGEDLDVNEAAAAGDKQRVAFLLERCGLAPTIRADGPFERPLHLAALFGRDEVALLLMSRFGYSPGEINGPFPSGGRVGPRATWDKTPLAVAVERGHEKTVDVLMNSIDFFQGRRARRK